MLDIEQPSTDYESQASSKHAVPKEDIEHPRHAKHPSIWLLLAVSMPRMAIQMAWASQWAALGPYLSTMLPHYAVQICEFTGPIVGVIVAPSVGVFSDRTTLRLGRRRPFLITAALLSIVFWVAMGYTNTIGEDLGDSIDDSDSDETHRTWTAVFTLVFYLGVDITVNVVQTPAMLLVADFAGDRQTLGAALGQAWATLGSLVVGGYIQLFGAAYNSLHTFMGMLSVAMFVCVGVATVVAKETPLHPSQTDGVPACERIGQALASVVHGLRSLPTVLAVYGLAFFFVQYGFTSYNSNKGQFFGLEVYDGEALNADTCGHRCSEEQKAYSRGVRIAGGFADLLFNIVGYVSSWLVPSLVHKLGAKWMLTLTAIPEMLFTIMAWSDSVSFNLAVIAAVGATQATWNALLVPAVVHVFGDGEEIGVYVGALNSANCLGQLLTFAAGTGLVETSLGYKLPVFVGGVMSTLGFLTVLLLFRMKMYSM